MQTSWNILESCSRRRETEPLCELMLRGDGRESVRDTVMSRRKLTICQVSLLVGQ